MGSAEVANGSLTSQDVGVFSGTSTLDFPSVPGQSCLYEVVAPTGVGVNIDNDPVLVIPDDTVPQNIVVSPWRSNAPGAFRIRACNVTALPIDPPSATYHWVVFNN